MPEAGASRKRQISGLANSLRFDECRALAAAFERFEETWAHQAHTPNHRSRFRVIYATPHSKTRLPGIMAGIT
jgi:hypothetical protein